MTNPAVSSSVLSAAQTAGCFVIEATLPSNQTKTGWLSSETVTNYRNNLEEVVSLRQGYPKVGSAFAGLGPNSELA